MNTQQREKLLPQDPSHEYFMVFSQQSISIFFYISRLNWEGLRLIGCGMYEDEELLLNCLPNSLSLLLFDYVNDNLNLHIKITENFPGTFLDRIAGKLILTSSLTFFNHLIGFEWIKNFDATKNHLIRPNFHEISSEKPLKVFDKKINWFQQPSKKHSTLFFKVCHR